MNVGHKKLAYIYLTEMAYGMGADSTPITKDALLQIIKDFSHIDHKVFVHEKKLIYKIKNGLFSEQDEDKTKKKPTKFERNDKRREEERKKSTQNTMLLFGWTT